MSREHEQRVTTEFQKQAGNWAQADGEHRVSEMFQWILSHLQPKRSDSVLDLCGGTGNLSRAIAPLAREVTVYDLTPEMLAQGERLTRQQGLENVRFVQGRADAIGFADGSFDLAICKFGLHHIPTLEPVLAEVFRVLATRGRFAIVDAVAPSGVATAHLDEVELIRDPSHASFWPAAAYERACAALGARLTRRDAFNMRVAAAKWLKTANAGPEQERRLRELFGAELAGGEPTGLVPEAAQPELMLNVGCVYLEFAKCD
jgi:ubiquinone/menaquinone biosynthesis C-methylase UbiE